MDTVYELTILDPATGRQTLPPSRFCDSFLLSVIGDYTDMDMDSVHDGYDPLSFDGYRDEKSIVLIREVSPYTVTFVYSGNGAGIYTDTFMDFDSAREELENLWTLEEETYNPSALALCYISHVEVFDNIVDYMITFTAE